MMHILSHLPRALQSPVTERQTGTRRSAASASRVAGSVGAGYGVPNPMSTAARPVPVEVARVLRVTAQGIVTRMGQDPEGLGCEAIEPGPVGMRPALVAPRCHGCARACESRATGASAAQACAAGAGAGAGRATCPDGNHGDNQKKATQ